MRNRFVADDGANAVEFALVLPLLVMLIFGGVTAGLTLNAKQQINHASREAARYGATLPLGANACNATQPWQECVRDRAIGTALGSVDLTTGGVCVTLYEDHDDNAATPEQRSTWTYGTVTPEDPSATPPICVVESPALSGERVQVRVETPAKLDAVLVRTGLFRLSASAVARYEDAS